MQIESEKFGVWSVKYFPEYGRIHVYRKLRIPVGTKNWELVEDYHNQKKEDYERIVKEKKEKGSMSKFEVGKEYWARFWSKHDLLVGCKVLKKTEKTILVEFSDGEQKRFKLSAIPDFGEMFSPNKFYTFFAKNEGNWIRQRQKDYYGE